MRGDFLDLAKTFENGRSQAVRLPKKYRIDGDEVYIHKFKDVIMLIPKKTGWGIIEAATVYFTEDFMEDRNQPKPQNRNEL